MKGFHVLCGMCAAAHARAVPASSTTPHPGQAFSGQVKRAPAPKGLVEAQLGTQLQHWHDYRRLHSGSHLPGLHHPGAQRRLHRGQGRRGHKRRRKQLSMVAEQAEQGTDKTASEATQGAKTQKWDRSIPWVPTFIPYVGIGNVTEPTIKPPDPPKMKNNLDLQPLDTKLGDYILGQFSGGPTATPPPSQDSLDAAYACPDLEMPGTWKVQVDKNCEKPRHGMWTTTGGDEILSWKEVTDPEADGDLVMTLPYGDLMGYTRTLRAYEDQKADKVDIFDCGDNHIFTLEEKMEKKVVGGDQIYAIWDITSASGAHVATTSRVPLFANDWVLEDPGGKTIVKIHRQGAWHPHDQCPAYKMEYVLSVGNSGSKLKGKSKRWILATIITVLSLRDQDRDAGGFYQPNLDFQKAWAYDACYQVLWWVVPIVILLLFYYYAMDRVAAWLVNVEDEVLPKVPVKPSKFDP